MLNRKLLRIIGIFALVFNMLMVGYFFSQRTSFHIDEVFSYGHANSTQGAFLLDPLHTSSPNSVWNKYLFNRWFPGTLYHNYLTVQPKETFEYKHVYRNMSVDVHPPLFLILLHTICSFTPDVMSVWQGAFLQLLLWPIALLLLFKLTRLFFKEEFDVWAVVLFYAYSRAGLETVVFIRMYLLQTIFALGLVYGVCQIVKYKQANKAQWLWVGGMACLGMLTQYNSILFAGLVTLWGCILLLFAKRIKLIFQLILVMISSLGLSLLIFPSTIRILLTSKRSHEAITNLLSFNQFSWHAKIFAQDCLNYLWSIQVSGWIWPYVLIGIVAGFSWIYIKASRPLTKLLLLILTMGVCLNVLMPYMYIFNTRYYMMLMPFLALISLGYVMCFLRWAGKRIAPTYLHVIVVSLIALNSALVNFLYTSPYAFADKPVSRYLFNGARVLAWVPNPSVIYEFAPMFQYAGNVKIAYVALSREKLLQGLEDADYLVVLNRDVSAEYLTPPWDPVLFNHPQWIAHVGEGIKQRVAFVETVKVGSSFYDLYQVIHN